MKSQYKNGDKARIVKLDGASASGFSEGDVVTIVDADWQGFNQYEVRKRSGLLGYVSDRHLTKYEGEEMKPYQRKTYKLTKDTPTMRKGAILQEQCDDGTQPYVMLNNDTHCKDPSYKISIAKRELVEQAPQWFVEVFKVHPEYMTREELDKWEAFNGRKAAKKAVAAKAAPATKTKRRGAAAWTPEQRKAHGRRMKKMWAAKRAV